MFNPSKGERGTVIKAEYADGIFRSITLNLGESDTDDRVLGIMSTVFDRKLTPDEKRRILNNKYKTTVSDYLAKEMRKMKDYAKMFFDESVEEGIEKGFAKGFEQGFEKGFEKGFAKGFEQGRVMMCADLIRVTMSDGISVEEAMDKHRIPKYLRPAVLSHLNMIAHEA